MVDSIGGGGEGTELSHYQFTSFLLPSGYNRQVLIQ